MFSVPPMPPWDGMHPLVVHFPIALTFVAPLLVVLAVVFRKQTGTWLTAAALLMLIAALGAMLAVNTGEAAEEFAEEVASAQSVLHEHEELGEKARTILIVLAAAISAGAVAWRLWGAKAPGKVLYAAAAVYLVAHVADTLVVANTAHQGGRLVHELGVRARTAESVAANSTTLPPAEAKPEHDD
jgi:uncharacterized membrane protein